MWQPNYYRQGWGQTPFLQIPSAFVRTRDEMRSNGALLHNVPLATPGIVFSLSGCPSTSSRTLLPGKDEPVRLSELLENERCSNALLGNHLFANYGGKLHYRIRRIWTGPLNGNHSATDSGALGIRANIHDTSLPRDVVARLKAAYPFGNYGLFQKPPPCTYIHVVGAEAGARLYIGWKRPMTPESFAEFSAASFIDPDRWFLSTQAREGQSFKIPGGVPWGATAGVNLWQLDIDNSVNLFLHDWERQPRNELQLNTVSPAAAEYVCDLRRPSDEGIESYSVDGGRTWNDSTKSGILCRYVGDRDDHIQIVDLSPGVESLCEVKRRCSIMTVSAVSGAVELIYRTYDDGNSRSLQSIRIEEGRDVFVPRGVQVFCLGAARAFGRAIVAMPADPEAHSVMTTTIVDRKN